jgi:hypothetical protein
MQRGGAEVREALAAVRRGAVALRGAPREFVRGRADFQFRAARVRAIESAVIRTDLARNPVECVDLEAATTCRQPAGGKCAASAKRQDE